MAHATHSFRFLAGWLAGTTKMMETTVTWATGAKSLNWSYGIARVCGVTRSSPEPYPKSRVYPSGGALTTATRPVMAAPPGWFTTMRGCGMCFGATFAKARATTSVAPPAAYGTIRLMGLVG